MKKKSLITLAAIMGGIIVVLIAQEFQPGDFDLGELGKGGPLTEDQMDKKRQIVEQVQQNPQPFSKTLEDNDRALKEFQRTLDESK